MEHKACRVTWLVEHEGLFYNFYNAKKMPEWIEQIGLATSSDLMNWKRHSGNPILRVRPGGYDAKFCADGKVFRDGDHWVMFYFGVGKGGAHIMVAFSRDLIHWVADPEPLYKAGGNPSGLDKQFDIAVRIMNRPSKPAVSAPMTVMPTKKISSPMPGILKGKYSSGL